jgi:iron complex outermembrane receptor protein
VDNVFDEYPDFTPAALNSNGVPGFPFYSPFGFNGRHGYARLSASW